MASSAGKRRKGGKKDPAVSGAKRQHEDTTAAASSSESGERFTFFFGAESPFSQWHSATFTVACLKYNCAEQYMMHQKAVLFKDEATADEIMASCSPQEQKALGRQVKNFDHHQWKANCREIVKRGNLAKFSQNEELREELMKTRGTTLVEAAPRDTVWGIGLSAKNWKAKHREHWRGYANVVHDREVGFSYINCTGDEGGLEECSVGNLTSHNCTKAGIIHCFNNSQVVVSVSDQVRVFENEAIEFCVILWAPQPWQVDVLVSTNDSGLALAGYDYHPLKQIVSFEPSNATRLEQCLQIEIIDDSLAEYWEQFTVQLSTNNSAVNLTHHKFDVYIRPSDNITMCTEGSVTVVSDANNSSLQLVEMCSSEGVWSPVCDYDWTAEDVTVVCRELGFPDSESIRHATLNKTAAITGTSVECEGNEETIKECSTTQAEMDIRCTLVLVDCVVEDSDEETNNNDSGNSPNSSIASGTIAGVLVAVILVLLLVVILVIIFVILRRKTKQISVPSDQQYDSANARFQRSMEGVGEKHLDNPVYDSGKGLETFLQSGENFEHNLMNPLYSINTESTDSKPHDYATLESDAAEYEIPRCDTLPKNEAHPSTNAANYDYVDI